MRAGPSLRPGVVLLGALIVLGLVVRVIDAPAKQPAADILLKTASAPFFAIRNWALEQVALRRENARLRHLLAEATVQARWGQQAVREVQRLRVLLDQPLEPEVQVHIAQIVGWDRSGGYNEVIIDRGASGGLSRYAPAITESGVAGRVRVVLDRFARVQLLTDPASRVAVRDTRSGVLGVVRPRGRRDLIMDHVAIEADVLTGDTLVTAGVGGTYPAGLLVGTVRHAERISDSLLLKVRVQPAADLESLEYLFILESEAPLPPGAPYDVEGDDNGS